MRIMLLLLTATACSPPSAPSNTVVTSAIDATARPADVIKGDPPRPGTLRSFGDWAVGCDNIALCAMTSLGPENGGRPALVMTVLRQPGGEGHIDLSFQEPDEATPVSPRAVAVDDRSFRTADATRIVRAMANGAGMTVSGPAAGARISLNGASAALRWIDEQQGRAGTVTAIVARGPRPVSAVPAIRNPPTIRAVVPSGTPATPTAQQLTAMTQRAKCEMPPDVDADPTLAALGGGKTLVILPCSAGAYNLMAALFVLDAKGVSPAMLDAPSGIADGEPPAGVPSVVNAVWAQGELTSYAKGRGIGDCGVRQTFVWDGTRLRLSDQSAMGECRGNPIFIPTWRAQVVRG